MATLVKLREPAADERTEWERLARSRTEEARPVARATIVLGRAAASDGRHRFNAEGRTGRTDHPRPAFGPQGQASPAGSRGRAVAAGLVSGR